MGDEKGSSVDTVIFFDANMPRMPGCSNLCKIKKTQICRHRFNFNAKVLHTNEYINFLRFYDFQIILHCLYLIRKKANFRRISENGRFVIVTKDRAFLHDAEDAWLKRKKSKTRPTLEFGRNFVKCGSYKILVKIISCKNYGTDGHHDLLCVIDELNKMWLEHRADS